MRDWSKIRDPTGEFDFALEWSEIAGQYEPEEIQELIERRGVAGMVKVVNEHFWLISGSSRKPLLLVKQDGRKIVTLR